MTTVEVYVSVAAGLVLVLGGFGSLLLTVFVAAVQWGITTTRMKQVESRVAAAASVERVQALDRRLDDLGHQVDKGFADMRTLISGRAP